jgi:hypothetical protein
MSPLCRSVKLTCFRPFLQPIKLEDFEDIVSSEEAFFLYLQNFDTSIEELVTV